MRKPITRKGINALWMRLQSAVCAPKLERKHRTAIGDAMEMLADIQLDMRRKEIFAAGARARKPVPRFDGQELGSSEAVTFYDGYRSTHPKFDNPYRMGRHGR